MTYVRNAWYVSAWAHEIVPEQPVGVRIINEPIVIWRNAAGDLVAFEDRCIHRLAPLSLGRCEGDTLRCMYHGLLYDRSGRVIEIPGQDQIPKNTRVRSYPAVERHSWVWVWMGDAAAADESLIPPVAGMDNPDFLFGHGQLDYAAEARLINENLLDLTHVSFVHAESFQLSETWARGRPKVTTQARSVHIEWWIRNEPPMGGLDTSQTRVDTYLRYDFFVPGVLLMTARTYPAGTADALNGQEPDLAQAEVSITSQAITPITDKTARYFYIMGGRRSGDETVYDMATTEKAFAEDKIMIEAQQKNFNVTPDWRVMPTTADRGIMLFNRLVEKMAREESVGLRESTTNAERIDLK